MTDEQADRHYSGEKDVHLTTVQSETGPICYTCGTLYADATPKCPGESVTP
jgi:hypothetical protein